MQITQSIYIVSGSEYDQLGNVYAIRGKHGVALIDSGEETAAPVIEASLKRWGMGDLPVTHLLLTHGHMDHAGCAAYFQRKGAQIYVHEGDAHLLREGGFPADTTPYGEGYTFPPCEPDVILHDRDVVEFEDFRLEVCSLPGHTDGSVFYLMRERCDGLPKAYGRGSADSAAESDGYAVLFTGDTFSYDRDCGEDHILLCWKGSPDYDAAKLRKSFEYACQTFFPEVILSGHGTPYLGGDGNAVIRAAARKFLNEYR